MIAKFPATVNYPRHPARECWSALTGVASLAGVADALSGAVSPGQDS